MQKKTQDIKKRPKAKFSTTESSDELNNNSESSSGENVSDTVYESSPQLAERVEIPFSDFKALAKRNVCIAGSWFEGDFGRDNARFFFNGTLVKAIKASKTMPHCLELKFKGDRLTYYVTDRRSIIQYLVDD
jgi:hypothetical protein